MGEAELALLREIYEDWGRGDYRKTHYLHPEFELVYGSDFLDQGSFTGLAEASEGWRIWLSQWKFWSSSAREYIEVGDKVLVIIDVTGVAKSTGIELGQPSANLWEFRDGRPFRLTLYTHAQTAFEEAGIDAP
jgi:ketosteroid isomerase-like protein